jgi:hypothetical protein
VAASFLGHKESSHLTLHPRCHNDTIRLGQSLGSRRDVRHIAKYLTGRVEHDWP